jgi:hypothetical protein
MNKKVLKKNGGTIALQIKRVSNEEVRITMVRSKRYLSFSKQLSPSTTEIGQALVETALVTLILMLLLTITVDLGRAMFTWLAMHNAASEGAYYASAFPNFRGTVGTTDKDTIIYRVQHESPSELLDWTIPGVGVEITFEDNDGEADPGTLVTVGISYPFEFIGPVPGLFGINELTIYAEATQVVLTNLDND